MGSYSKVDRDLVHQYSLQGTKKNINFDVHMIGKQNPSPTKVHVTSSRNAKHDNPLTISAESRTLKLFQTFFFLFSNTNQSHTKASKYNTINNKVK